MKNLIYNYYIEEKGNTEKEAAQKRTEYILITDDIYLVKEKIRKLKSKDLTILDEYYFILDFSKKLLTYKNAKKIIKKIKFLSSKIKRNKNKIGINSEEKIIIGEITGVEQKYVNDILTALTVPLINTKKEKYEYLYDNACWYLDNEFSTQNLCDFQNNKCIGVDKLGNNNAGCCWHFRNIRFGVIYESPKNMIMCEHLGKYGCTTKNLMCKLIVCPNVAKKGVSFNVWNVLLIRYYFNIVQKYIILSTAFSSREDILKKLDKACFK